MADTPAHDLALLAGLRKAKGGPLSLQEKGGASPVAGMFPKGNAGKPLAERAQKEGLVEEV